jgi:copper ion binding protein
VAKEEEMSGLFGKKQGEELVVGIEGMSCMHCVGKVNKGLEEMEGVFSAEVDLEGKKAVVRYDPDRVEAEAIRKKIGDLGYQPV